MSVLLEPEDHDSPHEQVPVYISDKVLNKNQILHINEASHARPGEEFLWAQQEMRGPDHGLTDWIKDVE